MRSLGVSWWAVLQRVKLFGRDLAWPENLRSAEVGVNKEQDVADVEEDSGVGVLELQPEDTEVDDYLMEYILQSQMDDGEDDEDGSLLGDY